MKVIERRSVLGPFFICDLLRLIRYVSGIAT